MFSFSADQILKHGAAAFACLLFAGCVTSKPAADTTGNISTMTPRALGERAANQAATYKQEPHNVGNAVAYAETLGAMNRHEQQSAILEKVVMSSPASPDTMAAYGKSLIAVGQYARADQVLAQAFMADAPDWKTLSARGVANDKLGNHKEAEALYEAALRIIPDEPSVLTNLGLSHAYRRDYAKAELYLRRALAQPGADQRVQQNLAIVLGLQGKGAAEKEALAKVTNSDGATSAMGAVSQLKTNQQAAPRRGPAER